eukprot:scaffold803_cov310-Pinguiococcus_pyrenoidosus.AAC.80
MRWRFAAKWSPRIPLASFSCSSTCPSSPQPLPDWGWGWDSCSGSHSDWKSDSPQKCALGRRRTRPPGSAAAAACSRSSPPESRPWVVSSDPA